MPIKIKIFTSAKSNHSEDEVEIELHIQDEPPSKQEQALEDDKPFDASVVQTETSTETVLVGANLPTRYARNLAMIHAETGRSKKDLLMEALNDLFMKKGVVDSLTLGRFDPHRVNGRQLNHVVRL